MCKFEVGGPFSKILVQASGYAYSDVAYVPFIGAGREKKRLISKWQLLRNGWIEDDAIMV